MYYLFQKYPTYLSLDVSTDNEKAVHFYQRIGLQIAKTYLSEEKVEFANFETPKNFFPPVGILNSSGLKKMEEIKKEVIIKVQK